MRGTRRGWRNLAASRAARGGSRIRNRWIHNAASRVRYGRVGSRRRVGHGSRGPAPARGTGTDVATTPPLTTKTTQGGHYTLNRVPVGSYRVTTQRTPLANATPPPQNPRVSIVAETDVTAPDLDVDTKNDQDVRRAGDAAGSVRVR